MPYRLEVAGDVCLSSGKCVADAPSLFRFDDDEIAEPLADPVLPADVTLLDLARSCPSGALRVFNGDEEINVF